MTDVLVLGGGPAGAGTALALARGGASVVVVTRARRAHPRIGETVPPEVVSPLARLGVWEAFRAGGHAPAPGSVACWGADEPYENEYILSPYGDGWHLDRGRFDAMLLDAAAAAGAQVVELPRGARAERAGTGWSVPGTGERAGFVVDATGRAGSVAARRGVRRRRTDRLVGLVRFGIAAADEPRTVLEACADGWWYGAVLPQGRAVVAFFTDADLLPAGAAARARLWDDGHARTRLVRTVTTPTGAPTHVTAAHTGELVRCVGPGWLAVGDAARTLDPLSGQGLTTALTCALDAADAVLALDRPTALDAFGDRVAHEHRRHLATRRTHYRREGRWAQRPFWQRRHQPA